MVERIPSTGLTSMWLGCRKWFLLCSAARKEAGGLEASMNEKFSERWG